MVQTQSCPETIRSMFNSIAKGYDRANVILSFSLHKHWNRALVRELQPSRHLLDLCAGTGDIALEYLKQAKDPSQAILVDFSANMLEIAKQRARKIGKNHLLTFVEADVQHIPLKEEIADCASIAYGIRNVKDPSRCIQEAYRLLKPGGVFGILELTRPKSPFLRFGHRIYLKTVLPLFGEAYSYLSQSIQTFSEPAEIEQLMHEAGFRRTRQKALTGGIATLIIGQKG